jgi:hypothetical protein
MGDLDAGGSASLGPVFASSDFGGDVSVLGYATGGEGFSGRSVELINAVGGSTSGNLFLSQTASGGASRGGTAGSGTSQLEHTGASDRIWLQSTAWGGECAFNHSDCESAGGDAIASAAAYNTAGIVWVSTLAYAGDGGNAAEGRDGGRATSSAVGEALGNFAVVVDDVSFGGDGGESGVYRDATGGRGGDASSSAIATGGGTARVQASARAVGGAPGIVLPGVPRSAGGSARATATATGMLEAEASARATATNASREVTAIATGGGAIETVATHASSTSGNFGTSLEAIAGVASDAEFSSPGQGRIEGVAGGLAMPDDDRVDLYLDHSPLVADTVAAGASVLALGTLGFAFDMDDFDATVQFLLAEPSTNALRLGVANPSSSGDGFSSLVFQVSVDGTIQIDQSFADAASAALFFDDHVFPIADAGASDIELSIRSSVGNSGDRFGFAFALLAIPEPNTGGLLVFGMLMLTVYRHGRSRNERR